MCVCVCVFGRQRGGPRYRFVLGKRFRTPFSYRLGRPDVAAARRVVVIPRGCSRFSNRLRRASTTYTVLSVNIYFFNNDALPTSNISTVSTSHCLIYAVNNWFYAETEDGFRYIGTYMYIVHNIFFFL